MKKAIVLLLALTVIGGAAFAQVAFSGYVSTGVQYSSADEIKLVNSNVSGKTTRVRLTGAYTLEDAGAIFRLQSNDFAAPTFTQALVWGNLLDKMVTYKVGKLNDYTMATYWNSYGATDAKTGAQFLLKPVAGLVASVFLPVNATADTLSVMSKGIALAASSSIEGVVALLAGGNFLADTKTMFAQIDVTAVENLAATAEIYIADFDDIAPVLELDVSYALDALTIGLHNTDTFATDLAWYVDPYVDYSVSEKLTVGADFSYDSDSAYAVGAYAKVALTAKATFLSEVAYDGTDVVVNFSLDHSF